MSDVVSPRTFAVRRTVSRPSTLPLPQFEPPTMPGYWIEPESVGGVQMPSERSDAISSRHFPRSQGVKPNASSGVSVAGCSGAGARK